MQPGDTAGYKKITIRVFANLYFIPIFGENNQLRKTINEQKTNNIEPHFIDYYINRQTNLKLSMW